MKIKFVVMLYLLNTGIGKIYGQTELWSTSFQGGADNLGCIFKIHLDGTGYTHCYDFQTNYPGFNPNSTIPCFATNGKLYGMTQYGGNCTDGNIFSYDTVTHAYTNVFEFDGINGSYSSGSLMQASNGKLYGMTQIGGLYNNGVLFSFEITTGTFTKLFDFDGPVNGSNPFESLLIQAANGKLYGTTKAGGLNGGGTLFSFDPNTNIFFKEFDFIHATGEWATIFISTNTGILYGITSYGALNSTGTIFTFDINTHVLTHIFVMPSNYRASSIILATDGFLYGAGDFLFRMDTTGNNFTILPPSFALIGGATGRIIQASDGKIYGTTTLNKGYIFQFDIASSVLNSLYHFTGGANGSNPKSGMIETSPGNFYGFANNNGSMSAGIMYNFRLPSNSFTKIFDFNGTHSGALPRTSLLQAGNGKLYGTTFLGSNYDGGIIYKIDTSNYQVTKLHDFGDTLPQQNPVGKLVQATNGKIYGVLSHGCIYSLDPANDSLNIVYYFSSVAEVPDNIIAAADGNFYGTTKYSGTFGHGTIYRFDPALNTYADIFSFGDTISFNGDSLTGNLPSGNLMQASNGKLYGVTVDGGANGKGVIYCYDLVGNIFTKIFDFDVINGQNPIGYLTEVPNGKLYGLTYIGGQFNDGTLFSIDTLTGVFTKLFDFQDTLSIHSPGSDLFLASNGKLYGMTSRDGAEDVGTIFSFDLSNNTYLKLRDLSCSSDDDGLYAGYSHFIELPATSPNGFGHSPNTSLTTPLLISPNPVNDNITIYSTALTGKIAVIKITDIAGLETFKKEKINISDGNLNVSVNTKKLSSGIYFLIVQTEKEKLVRKFVKE